MRRLDRRTFFACMSSLGLGGTAFASELWSQQQEAPEITKETIARAEELCGLSFKDEQREMMLRGLRGYRASYERLRGAHLENSVMPAQVFHPDGGGPVPRGPASKPFPAVAPPSVNGDEELAFLTVRQLGTLLRSGRLTSARLTRFCLERLKKHDPKLHCVITLTEERALAQAGRMDRELKAGKDRGPLHGIPWGAKDLLDTKGIRTTWGAMPFKDRVPDRDATVVERLDAAGAVLVAKLTLGALAMGDTWFGGRTRNPWNPEQGSSGSSAGSASAVVAGLVPFAIGTETLGSIVSPCTRCGATGLRPTFGRVSRHGAMALTWTMDKIGPIARDVVDCALVLEAIRGPDGKDPSVLERPLGLDPGLKLQDLRIGFLENEFRRKRRTSASDDAVLDQLQKLGAKLVPVRLPAKPLRNPRDLLLILRAESATAFEEITRDGRVDSMARQGPGAWPNSFRQGQLVPAVEYLRASRIRSLLMEEMGRLMEPLDVLVARSFGGNLVPTNLTGHPVVVMPHGFRENGTPTSITFIGALYGEAKLVAAAAAWQEATPFNERHPDLG